MSELRLPEKANPKVVAWASSVPLVGIFICAVTILEIEIGARAIARRDGAQGRVLRHWVDEQIMPQFFDRILPVDAVVAQHCARLHIPDPRTECDALIAATAIAHRMTLVTRNVEDFTMMDAPVFNPWDDKT